MLVVNMLYFTETQYKTVVPAGCAAGQQVNIYNITLLRQYLL